MNTNRRNFAIALGLAATAGAGAFRHSLANLFIGDPKQAVLTRIDVHCDTATREAQQAASECVAEFDAWFAGQAAHSRELANDLLSFTGKWNLAASQMPWGDPNCFRNYAERKFRERIFSANDIRKHAALASQHLAAGLRAIENKMLVNARADLDSIDPAMFGRTSTTPSLDRAYAGALQAAVQGAKWENRVDMAQLVAVEVVQYVIVKIFEQTVEEGLVSAGVLGAGGLGAPETFGLSLLLGLLVDQIISWFTDSEGHLATTLHDQISKIRQCIIDGTDEQPGLDEVFQTLALRWASLRTTALRNCVAQAISTSTSAR